MTIDPELCETFLAEASDLFERIESLVVELGNGRGGSEVLAELGRCFHTMKGAAGSVGLVQVAAMVHCMEDRLDGVSQSGEPGLLEPLHQLLAYLESVFESLRRGGTPEPDPIAKTQTRSSETAASADWFAPEPQRSHDPVPSRSTALEPAAHTNPESGPNEGPIRVSSERVDVLMDLVSELITRRGLWASQAETMKEFATMARTSRGRLLATVDKLRDLDLAREHKTSRAVLEHEHEYPGLIRRIAEQADDVAVLTESAQAAAKPLSDNCEALARLTLKLWEALQSIRILPVRGLFQRLTRVAQDAARVEGRQVEVVMIGEETGLDRAVLDKAVEPLLHVVRNAVCHGIEPASERVAKGKSPVGRITLEATRAGNTLVITVQDDGRGLDYEAIAAKGRRVGLIAQGENPSVERLNALIFQSGFSTREEASAIAGRGVGMDVVSQEVSRLHGTVSLTSKTNQGMRLSISLPARLALEQAMISRVNGRSFALPVSLIEQAQPFVPSEADRSGTWPRLQMRDRWIPVIDAREALGFATSVVVASPKVVSVRADGERLAVVVNAIDGTAELAIKPLSPLLSGHPIVSGTSLSVTGEVIFALNPAGLARRLRDVGGSLSTQARGIDQPKAARVLVVNDSISVRKVVARQLTALGYEIEEVSDGLEALGKLRNHSYSLVVSDLEMPRMDGFELLAELSRLGILATVPVLMASTRSDPDTLAKALELGAATSSRSRSRSKSWPPKPARRSRSSRMFHSVNDAIYTQTLALMQKSCDGTNHAEATGPGDRR